MPEIGAASFAQNTNSQKMNAEEFNGLVKKISEVISDVDAAIVALVNNGLTGSSVKAMVATYVKNREEIEKFVNTYSNVARIAHASAVATEKLEAALETAAMGKE
mgnify:CR=1 FL=1